MANKTVTKKKKTATPRATRTTDAYISGSGVRNAATGQRISRTNNRPTDAYVSTSGTVRNAATGQRVSSGRRGLIGSSVRGNRGKKRY